MLVFFSHFHGFSHFAASLLPIPPPDIFNYDLVLGLIVAESCLLVAYNYLELFLPTFRYLYFVELFLWAITWTAQSGTVIRHIGFAPPYFRTILDCFAVVRTLRMISSFRRFSFGLEVSELKDYTWSYSDSEWTKKRETVWKPYISCNYFSRKSEFEEVGFSAFRFVPFGVFNFSYSW